MSESIWCLSSHCLGYLLNIMFSSSIHFLSGFSLPHGCWMEGLRVHGPHLHHSPSTDSSVESTSLLLGKCQQWTWLCSGLCGRTQSSLGICPGVLGLGHMEVLFQFSQKPPRGCTQLAQAFTPTNSKEGSSSHTLTACQLFLNGSHSDLGEMES